MTSTILPLEYSPKSVMEFVGPARAVARQIEKAAATCMPRGVSCAYLFYGESGCGKTALASFTMRCFDVPKWNLVKKPGSDLTVEAMREIANDLRMTSMYGGFRGFQFDEIDLSKKDGQGRFLTVADDLPKNVVIAATCNSRIDDLEERFSRRFQVFEIKGPTAAEMIPLTQQWVSAPEAEKLCTIAAQDDNNARRVRPINAGAFLRDLTTYIQNKS